MTPKDREHRENGKTEEDWKRALSLQEATFESTADGLLVVDRQGRIVSYNRRFADMWRIPEDVLATRDDNKAIAHVLDQLQEPDRFVAEIKDLYAKPFEESFDVLVFKDGRVFDRLSRPQLIDGAPVGRVWSFRDVTEYRRVENRLRGFQEKLRQLSARREMDLEEERLRIAREVHDGLGQSLTAIRLEAEWCRRILEGRETRSAATEMIERIDSIVSLVDSTTDGIRKIAAQLRPSALDDLGLEAAIELEARDFERRTGIGTAVAIDGELEPVGVEKRLAVFRIFQEAMTNVARHAQARRVVIRLSSDHTGLSLVVSDDGVGFSLSTELEARSLGLMGMKERALQFGGCLVIDGAEPRGTRVTLFLPGAEG